MPELTEDLLIECRLRHLRIATAESCTGGLIAAAFTDIAGSSDVFDRGFVTYSNEAKTQMLGVPADLISIHGAVSAPVAEAMASGALSHSMAQLSVAVTGIAGPGGGSEEKPVGTVYIAVAMVSQPVQVARCHFDGDRSSIRLAAVQKSMEMMRDMLSSST